MDGQKASGKVEYVDFSDTSGASVSIKGKMYPLSAVTKVYPQDTTVEDGDSNFFKTGVASIANNLTNIANAIFGYENGDDSSNNTTTPENSTPNENK